MFARYDEKPMVLVRDSASSLLSGFTLLMLAMFSLILGGGCVFRRRQILSSGAGLPGLELLPALSEFGQGMVVPGRGDQGDAPGPTVIPKAAG